MHTKNPGCTPPNTPLQTVECRPPGFHTPLHLPDHSIYDGDLFHPLYIQVMPSGIPSSGWTSDKRSGNIDVFTAVNPPIVPVRTGMHVELAAHALADPLYHTVPAALLFGRVLSIHDAADNKAAMVISLQVTTVDRYVLVLLDRKYTRRIALDGYFGLIENVPSVPAAALDVLVTRCANNLPTLTPPVPAVSDENAPMPENKIRGMVCASDPEPPVSFIEGRDVVFHGCESDDSECECAEGGIWSIGKLWV